MESSPSPEPKAAIPKPEHFPNHLKEGVPAIMACIGTPDDFRESPGLEKFVFRKTSFMDIPGAYNVDYSGPHRLLVEQNFKNPETGSYVISPIDDFNKFSQTFHDCTGLVVAGYDKKTGQNISFLSHQDPKYFSETKANRDTLISDLRERLLELKERCREGTIDAAIFGGKYLKPVNSENSRLYQKNYLDSIKLLADETKKVLGFEPIVMTGPKKARYGADDVFYDNEHRRLYIARPEVGDSSTQSFTPSAIEDQEKKW